MRLFSALAGTLLATPALIEGYDALTSPQGHVQRAEDLIDSAPVSLGLSTVSEAQIVHATQITGGVMVASGALLALGIFPRANAALLAGLTVPLALANNPLWNAQSPEARAKHLAGLVNYGARIGGYLALASRGKARRRSNHSA